MRREINPDLDKKDDKMYIIDQYKNIAIDPDLILELLFSGNWNDTSGNNLNAIEVNSPSYSSPVNNVANLSSTGSLKVTDSDLLTFADGSSDKPFSISFKIKGAIITSPYSFLFAKRGDPSNAEYQIIFDTTFGGIAVALFSGGGTSVYIYARTGNLSWNSSNEYHIVVTYSGNGANTGISIYINKVSQSLTRSVAGTYSKMVNGNNDLSIGSLFTSTAYRWNGYMDSIRIYKKELSQSEIDALYLI